MWLHIPSPVYCAGVECSTSGSRLAALPGSRTVCYVEESPGHHPDLAARMQMESLHGLYLVDDLTTFPMLRRSAARWISSLAASPSALLLRRTAKGTDDER